MKSGIISNLAATSHTINLNIEGFFNFQVIKVGMEREAWIVSYTYNQTNKILFLILKTLKQVKKVARSISFLPCLGGV